MAAEKIDTKEEKNEQAEDKRSSQPQKKKKGQEELTSSSKEKASSSTKKEKSDSGKKNTSSRKKPTVSERRKIGSPKVNKPKTGERKTYPSAEEQKRKQTKSKKKTEQKDQQQEKARENTQQKKEDSKNIKQNNQSQDSNTSKQREHHRNVDMANFVETSKIKEISNRSKMYLEAGYPVHFIGPAGVGKTSLALHIARQYDQPIMLLQGNHEMSNSDLLGGMTGYTSSKVIDNYVRAVYKKQEEVNEKWSKGRLVEAVKNGYTLVYDEFTRSRPETNNLFLSVLEEGILPLYGTKQNESFVRVHPNFKVIFTSNPEEYAGVYESQDALLDRLITMELDAGHNSNTELDIVKERTDISDDEAELIVNLVKKIRQRCAEEDEQGPSYRASIMISEIAAKNDISIRSSDEDFVRLCKDVLGAVVSKCFEGDSIEEAEDMVEEELRKG
ncbi:gas vesicle protein GvpN [Thalassorhabdus alkalitolerans]|uniref:Gas vesicle protein GvpN n=1 Tax=Thalassorhabdus alkalitolerans TaxID=2282697 RepID=A0ABW0YNA1_9BACI